MNNIRKIVIGKEYTVNAMNYTVGRKVVQNRYTVNSIIREDDGSVSIYIEDEQEIMLWKTINEYVPFVLEYSQDFS